MKKRPKYGNHKVTYMGHTFDSEGEMARFIFLSNRAKEGEISELKTQVEFLLIPPQYKTEIKHLKTKDKEVQRLIERPCSYRADFTYMRDGKLVVEDFKGVSRGRFSTQTPDFKIKKKLLLYVHGIEVEIVSNPTQWKIFEKK